MQDRSYLMSSHPINSHGRHLSLVQSIMVWYGNSLFDTTEKYIVIAKYLIKYMIYVWRLHKEYTGCSLPCSHQR